MAMAKAVVAGVRKIETVSGPIPPELLRIYGMDTVKQILGLQENEGKDGKLKPEVVVYLKPEVIGNKEGAHCGACFFFNRPTSECFLTSPAHCNAEHGVCDFYLGGNLFEAINKHEGKPQPQKVVPKKVAGYIEKGPTHCANCEYFGGKEYPGECSKVQGAVEGEGCCNAWESAD